VGLIASFFAHGLSNLLYKINEHVECQQSQCISS